ncbi:MAG TPA: hypothetical protein VEC99_08290 [Clostridia bacterium]|nr:hypothetical protein [Clostridia bacterium]
MNTKLLLLIGGAAFLLAGCASYDRGGTTNGYDVTTGAGESRPIPAASPTMRPGMNPYDPRDAHFTTRPQPMQSPAITSP